MKMKIVGRLGYTVALTLAMLTGSSAVMAQSKQADTDSRIKDMVGNPAKFQEMMANLQQAVAKHDAAAVAALVSYPITVNPHTKTAMKISKPPTFIARYDKIITPHIAGVIEKQKYQDLFVNYQGAMFGKGEVWIAGICKDKECKQTDIRIKTIQNTSGRKK
jgi:hypothetical protein